VVGAVSIGSSACFKVSMVILFCESWSRAKLADGPIFTHGVRANPQRRPPAWPFPSAGWRAFSPGQNYLLSATVGPTVNESIVHLSVAFWQFPPRDDGLLRNRQKGEVAMEPTRLHRMLQSVMTRRPRKVTSFVRSIEVHPQIAVYGSQRMCLSCGAITARSKPFCLECGELLPAV
jgi:hypothetical protein